mmetsp:Transcript_2950/g.7356  ORF Transcript_2950/g.7356 Transcript_2950/m.7356 type:complete len:268 (+) Transcript_2950:410-1213(+)
MSHRRSISSNESIPASTHTSRTLPTPRTFPLHTSPPSPSERINSLLVPPSIPYLPTSIMCTVAWHLTDTPQCSPPQPPPPPPPPSAHAGVESTGLTTGGAASTGMCPPASSRRSKCALNRRMNSLKHSSPILSGEESASPIKWRRRRWWSTSAPDIVSLSLSERSSRYSGPLWRSESTMASKDSSNVGCTWWLSLRMCWKWRKRICAAHGATRRAHSRLRPCSYASRSRRRLCARSEIAASSSLSRGRLLNFSESNSPEQTRQRGVP